MKTKQGRKGSDLEDGEIPEEGFSDISDCSITEIITMKKDLEGEEDVDLDLLREEALKSMPKGEEENNEEELEEELCRLEALKSLLKNIEATDDLTSVKEMEKKRRPKRKRKQETKHQRKKSKDASALSVAQPVVIEKKEKDSQNQSVKTAPCREWYPTAEFALVCNVPPEDVPVKTEVKMSPTQLPPTNNARIPNLRAINYVKRSSPLKNRSVKCNFDQSSLPKLSPFKKVTKHSIRKFDSTLPANPVKPFVHQNNLKKWKYKLVNNANNVTNKFPPASRMNGLQNRSSSKSLFSINRLKCPKITIPPKEFIIELDDKDSDQEELSETSTGTNGTITPIICDIKVERDEVPAAAEQPNETESKPLVTKDRCSKITPDAEDDQSKTNYSSRKDVVQREPVFSAPRSSSPRSDALLVDSRKDESVAEDAKMVCSSKSNMVLGEQVNANTRDAAVLVEAEGCLVKIREKLLSDLGELEKTLKRNSIEQEKLNALLKKLGLLRSMVAKFETKVELQQSRLSANVACLNCLFNGVQTRTLTCSKFEEVCRTVGKNLLGPIYKPPNKLESVIAEKRKSIIDFSKFQPAASSK